MLPKKEPVSFEEQLLRSCPALARWQRIVENAGETPDDDASAPDPAAGDDTTPDTGMDDDGMGPSAQDDDVESQMQHPIDPQDIAQVAHEIGEIKTLLDKGKDDMAKKALHNLWSQVKHFDNVHDGDDDAIHNM